MMAVLIAKASDSSSAIREVLRKVADIPKQGEKRLAYEVIAVSLDDYFVEFDKELYEQLLADIRADSSQLYDLRNQNKKLFEQADAARTAKKFFESKVFEFWSYTADLEPDYIRRLINAFENHEKQQAA